MQNQCADQLHCNRAAHLIVIHKTYNPSTSQIQGARWLSGRKWTLEREVGSSKPTSARMCVLEQVHVLVIPRKWWLRPDMTDKLLIGTVNLNTNKHNFTNPKFQASSLCGCTVQFVLDPVAYPEESVSCDEYDLCHR